MPHSGYVIGITSIGPPSFIAASKREINLMVRCNDWKFLGFEMKVNAHDVNFLPQQAWEVPLLVSRFNLLSPGTFNIMWHLSRCLAKLRHEKNAQ